MTVIALTSAKGSPGVTTTALALAWAWPQIAPGRRVLVVDHAKAAGVPCRHLDADFRCLIFTSPERPKCCSGLQASPEMCGETRGQALIWLSNLEAATRPG